MSARSHIGSRYRLSIRRGICGEACWPCLACDQAQPDAEAMLTVWPSTLKGDLGGKSRIARTSARMARCLALMPALLVDKKRLLKSLWISNPKSL